MEAMSGASIAIQLGIILVETTAFRGAMIPCPICVLLTLCLHPGTAHGVHNKMALVKLALMLATNADAVNKGLGIALVECLQFMHRHLAEPQALGVSFLQH